MVTLRAVAAATALALSTVLVAGCDEEGYDPETEADVAPPGGYVPAYYDGYVVYYDDIGRPYYYEGGAVVWVSPGSPYYPGLTHHWRVYGPYYRGWYAHYGYRYRPYRYGPGYYGYHGYSRGAYHGRRGHR